MFQAKLCYTTVTDTCTLQLIDHPGALSSIIATRRSCRCSADVRVLLNLHVSLVSQVSPRFLGIMRASRYALLCTEETRPVKSLTDRPTELKFSTPLILDIIFDAGFQAHHIVRFTATRRAVAVPFYLHPVYTSILTPVASF